MSDHDRELAALLLVNRLSLTPAEPLKASEYWSLLDAVADPSVLLGLDGTAVASRAALDQATGDRIAALLDGATAFAIERERLEESGIHIFSSLSTSFPERLRRLGTACPACLYVAGRAAALEEGGLGVVGSRDVDEKGAAVASLAAEHAVAVGRPVISGLARGVDQTSMAAALQRRRTARRRTYRGPTESRPSARCPPGGTRRAPHAGEPVLARCRLHRRQCHGPQQAHLRPGRRDVGRRL